MALIDKELIFDITNGTNRYITVKANDSTGSRAFIFKIVNDNKLFSIKNLLVKVTGKKPDGKDVVIDAEIIDVNNSIIKFNITTQMQTATGVLDLELLFLKDSVVLSSIPFKVGVIDSARDNKEIESSAEYGSFTKGLVKLDEWDKIFKETSNKIEEKYTERLNQVDSQLAQTIKKDGSVKINGFLKVQREGKLEGWDFGQDTTGRYRIKKINADGSEGQSYVFEDNIFYPYNTNTSELGVASRPWKDAWIGSNLKNKNSGTNRNNNGYLEQYGQVEVIFTNSSSASSTVNLTETFPGAICEGFGNMGSNTSNAASFIIAVSIDNRSRLNIRVYCTTGAITGTYIVNWKVMGW